MWAVTWFSVTPGLQKLHRLPVRGVTDGAHHAQALLLVDVLDGAGFHHGGHAVGPLDVGVLESLDHVDVDEVDAEFLALDAALLHFLDDRLGELLDLLLRGRSRGALDPGVGPPDVLLRNPRRMALDLESEVALLEEHRRIVATDDGVAQAGLEAVPARCQCAGDVADVLVVHAEHRAEAVRLHALARALRSILPHPVPVDTLLPVESRDSEISSHVCSGS